MFYFLKFISELLNSGIVVFLDSENSLVEFTFVAAENIGANVWLHDACTDCVMNHKHINTQKAPNKTFFGLIVHWRNETSLFWCVTPGLVCGRLAQFIFYLPLLCA